MPETLVSDLVELIADKQAADPSNPEAYIGLEHIPEGAIRIAKVGTTEAIRGMCVRYREGDILFAKLRPNLRKSVLAPIGGLGSTEILVLRPKPGVDPSYAGHVLRSEAVFFEAERMTEGTRMPRTSWKTLSGIEVVSPSKADAQKIIATVLDAVDESILEANAVIEKLRVIRLGLVEELIPATQSPTRLGSLKRPNIPFVRTGPFGTTLRGIRWQASGVPVIPIAALSSAGIDHQGLDYISPVDAEALSSFKVSPGQILFSRVADVGRCAVVQPDQNGWIMSSNLMCMEMDAKLINPDYAQIVLSSHRTVRRSISGRVNAGGRDVMNSNILSSIEIPLVEIDCQERIVERIHAFDATLDLERAKRNKYSQIREGLRDDLLTGRVSIVEIREAAE